MISSGCDVIVGKGNIEGVKFGSESCGVVAFTIAGMVYASEVALPVRIPRAGIVRCGVALA